jgi:crossover junction endodeoxyribonuclease RuvC
MANFPRILGIDPGSRIVGFALIGARKAVPRVPADWKILDAGIMRANANLAMPPRLSELHAALFDLVAELEPTAVGIEKAFHGVNAQSAIKLGEARGALIAAIGRHGIPMHELTPAEVKRVVAGHGAACKEQVYQALQALMGFDKGSLPMDASDALAIAFAVSLKAFLPVSVTSREASPKRLSSPPGY